MKPDSDIELWHKRISHINLDKLKAMKSKGVVIGLPTFKEKEIEGVCEALSRKSIDQSSYVLKLELNNKKILVTSLVMCLVS